MNLMIRQLRKKLHISRTDFASRIGVSLRTVGSWERGESIPNAEQLWNCAVALGCSPNDILGWVEERGSGLESDFERELLDCYRACTPSRQDRILDTARDAAGMSKKQPNVLHMNPSGKLRASKNWRLGKWRK